MHYALDECWEGLQVESGIVVKKNRKIDTWAAATICFTTLRFLLVS